MDRILGVVIGLATVCLLFSIIASHMQEIWASFSARRAAALEMALQHMLNDSALMDAFFAHPLIRSISFSSTRSAIAGADDPSTRRPSYIGSDVFSKVLQSVLVSTNNLNTKELQSLIKGLPDSQIKKRITTLTMGIEEDAGACNEAIEKWYDDTMDRINGLYKRNTQIVLLVLGLVLAISCNVNLLHVAGTLWTSAAARDEVNAVAQLYGCKDGASCDVAEYKGARDEIEQNLKILPLGYAGFDLYTYWNTIFQKWDPGILRDWASNVCGWLLTAIAVSLGAPFWFDLVNKLVNIRMVGEKPDTVADRKATSRAT
jgi:hypothetical protein